MEIGVGAKRDRGSEQETHLRRRSYFQPMITKKEGAGGVGDLQKKKNSQPEGMNGWETYGWGKCLTMPIISFANF